MTKAKTKRIRDAEAKVADAEFAGTTPANAKSAGAKRVADPDRDPPPRDLDQLRYGLIRKANNMLETWRRCRVPLCRRSKRCLHADLACERDRPRLNLTPEEDARAASEMHRAIRRELERRGLEKGR